MYRNVFFLGPDNTLIISQHLSNDSAYRHSSSMGLVVGSGDDSSNINKASAAVYGSPAISNNQITCEIKSKSIVMFKVLQPVNITANLKVFIA